MLDNVRGLFAPEATPAAAPAAAARTALRQKVAARAPAAEALAEAERATARVRAIIPEAARAHDAAQRAEDNAEEAARQWAAAGALGDAPSDAAVVAAQRAAEAAITRAQGAQAALPRVIEAEDRARAALSRADDSILEAAFDVVLAEVVAPVIARAMEVRETFVAGLHMAVALAELTTPFRWGAAHRYHGFVGAHASGESTLHAVAPPAALDGDDPNVRELMDKLAAHARRLVTDPGAQWMEG